MIDMQLFNMMLDDAGEKAFEVMVEQMNRNPDAIEALYGGE